MMKTINLSKIISTLESGSRPKGGKQDKGIISIGGGQLSKDGGFNFKSPPYIPREYYDNLKKGRIEKNDILIVKDGATTGKTSFVDDTFSYEKAAINEHIFKLRINSKLANAKFVFYYLFSPKGQIDILRDYRGAAIGGITRKFAEKIEIPYFDLQTQNKIVEVLDRASALVKKREQSIALLDELLRATFLDMFGDPVRNPKDWKIISLSDFGFFKNGLNFSRNEKGFTIKCLGVGDFKKLSKISDIDSLSTLNVENEPSKDYLLNNEDLVFVRSNGNKSLVGRCVIVFPNNMKVTFSGFCIRYRINDKTLIPIYISHLFRDINFRSAILQKGRGANIQNINQKMLGELSIPLPPKKLQVQFNQVVEKIENQLEKLNFSLQQMNNVFCSLTQKVFNGEINFNIDLELDALVRAIDLEKKENDLSKIVRDNSYLQRLVDKLNTQEFEEKEMYDKAKHAAFQLLKENKKITQEYNEKTNNVKLVLK